MSDEERIAVTPPAAQAILARHRLPAWPSLSTPWEGATSRVYPLGTVVLKVPHRDPVAIHALRTDVLVSPIARAAGVSTLALLVLDETRE